MAIESSRNVNFVAKQHLSLIYFAVYYDGFLNYNIGMQSLSLLLLLLFTSLWETFSRKYLFFSRYFYKSYNNNFVPKNYFWYYSTLFNGFYFLQSIFRLPIFVSLFFVLWFRCSLNEIYKIILQRYLIIIHTDF